MVIHTKNVKIGHILQINGSFLSRIYFKLDSFMSINIFKNACKLKNKIFINYDPFIHQTSIKMIYKKNMGRYEKIFMIYHHMIH